jgi:carbonic anhydrase
MAHYDEQKRTFLRRVGWCGTGLASALYAGAGYAASARKTDLTPQQVLRVLKEGNAKFVSETPGRPLLSKERRLEIARGQAPIAVILSCSDSRVPPELLFSRGLGELFIVRNAGNTVDTVAIGSIEYAVVELGVPLVLVMGHERCGAVEAAVSVVEKQTNFPGSIGQMIEPIVPAVLKAQADLGGKAITHDALLDASVRANVVRVVTRLREGEALLQEPLRTKKLMVVGSRYDLEDGRVEFFAA